MPLATEITDRRLAHQALIRLLTGPPCPIPLLTTVPETGSGSHMYNVYVSGDVHTQMIEGFWSLVKRGLSGTHHAVSAKYLQGYLNEYVWRYNNRDAEGPAMFLLLILRAANTEVAAGGFRRRALSDFP